MTKPNKTSTDEVTKLRLKLKAQRRAYEETAKKIAEKERDLVKIEVAISPMDAIVAYCESSGYENVDNEHGEYLKQEEDPDLGMITYNISILHTDKLCYNFWVQAVDEDDLIVDEYFETQELLLKYVKSYQLPKFKLTATVSTFACTKESGKYKLKKKFQELGDNNLSAYMTISNDQLQIIIEDVPSPATGTS